MEPWKYIATLPGGSAPLFDWKRSLGKWEHFDSFRTRYLKPTGRLAASIRCDHACGDGCPMNVVVHSVEDVRLVCSQRYEKHQSIEHCDIAIFAVDWHKLFASIGRQLGIDSHAPEKLNSHQSWKIGAFRTKRTGAIPVYFTHKIECTDLVDVIKDIILSHSGPFLLLTISESIRSSRSDELLQHRSGHLFALENVATVERTGELSFSYSAHQALRNIAEGQTAFGVMEKESPYIFRKRGQKWECRYDGGESIYLNDTKGARYIHDLVTMPYRFVSTLHLHSNGTADAQVEAAINQQGIDILDSKGITDLKNRRRDLKEELLECEDRHDFDQAAEIQEELDAMAAYVAESRTKQGRKAKANDPQKKPRDAVLKAVKVVYNALIDAERPEIAQHLRSSMKTGSIFCYSPPSDITWDTLPVTD